jgi:predicted ATP-grasp superfamily ATP-dependent carboligase
LNNCPKVLLASAPSGGTIAAVRYLGANGYEVGVVTSDRLGAAAWSQYAARTYSAPPESENERFFERLLAIGASDPGQILLPTSDETAWLYANNVDQLGRYFRLAQPSVEVLFNILDKTHFGDAAMRAGIAVLPSWTPQTLDDVAALAPILPYPILIKPRTHVHRLRNDKGIVVHSASELTTKYQQYVDREQVRFEQNPAPRDATLPILQQFVRIGAEGVLSVTGFIDRTGELFVARSAIKVFQRSQPVGVGVCFESRPLPAAMSDTVRRLCREIGYFGIFEVEFLWFDGRWVGIDFNPRLFNQVGMDIRRGMPLPLFACLESAGEIASLREAVLKAREDQDDQAAFCDRFTLRAILLAQTVTGRISPKDRAYWLNWIRLKAGHTVDFVADEGDRIPELIHILSEIYLGIKSFPRFLRSTPRTLTKASHSLTKARS